MLEVGGGTGGTTAAVLPVLPADRTEYLFTDVSPGVHGARRERFRDSAVPADAPARPRARSARAGPRARSFDVVIAANVVHATRDLRRTLAHCLRLLAPGGLLVMLEVTAPQRWIDVTFGLTDGWWHFTDHDLRADYPLLSPAQWRALLAELGRGRGRDDSRDDRHGGRACGEHRDPGPAPRRVSGSAVARARRRAGVGEALAAALGAARRAGGARQRRRDCGPHGAHRWSVRPAVREDLARLVAEGAGGDGALAGVVHCWALDAPEDGRGADVDAAQRASCGSLLSLTQALVGPGVAGAPGSWW